MSQTAPAQARAGCRRHRTILALLAALAGMPTAVVPVAGVIRNTNTLLDQDGIVGLKTGSTQAARGCLLVAAWHEVGERKTLIVAAAFGHGPPGAR